MILDVILDNFIGVSIAYTEIDSACRKCTHHNSAEERLIKKKKKGFIYIYTIYKGPFCLLKDPDIIIGETMFCSFCSQHLELILACFALRL